jgi:mRNA interferase MazF
MPTSGDVVRVDLGTRIGSEAGMVRPAIVVTAQRVLDHSPTVVHVVPLTTTIRDWASEVTIPAGPEAGLDEVSAAQCQHVHAISTRRIVDAVGNVGPMALRQIRETVAVLLDL